MAGFLDSQSYVSAMGSGSWNESGIKKKFHDEFELILVGTAEGYESEFPLKAELKERAATNYLGTVQKYFQIEKSTSTQIKKVSANHFTTEVKLVMKLRNNCQDIRIKNDYNINIYFKDDKIHRVEHIFTSKKLEDGDPGIIDEKIPNEYNDDKMHAY